MNVIGKLIIGVIAIAVIGMIAYPVIKGSVDRAEVLNVMVRVEGNMTHAQIMDVTASIGYVNKISEPKGTPVEMPGITIYAIKDMSPIGYWTSTKYNGTGRYNLTMGLTKYPKVGDLVTLTVRVTNADGELDAIAAPVNLTSS